MLTAYVIKSIFDLCSQAKVPIFADPKYNHFESLAKGAVIFKPNLSELEQAAKRKISPSVEDIYLAVNELKLSHSDLILVTLGEKGIFYADNKRNSKGVIVGQAIKDADVSGAGDTVIAVLAWAYISGYQLEEMLSYANKAGARVCLQQGVSTIVLNDVLDDI